MSTASPAILSNFFEKQWTQNHPFRGCRVHFIRQLTFLEIAAYFSEFIGICLKNIMLIKYSTKNSKVESLNNKTNLINFRYFPSKALNNINRTIQSVFFVPS